MNEYIPTDREQALIEAFWTLYPHYELASSLDQHITAKAIAAMGQELFLSLNSNDYSIEIDKNLIQSRGLKPDEDGFFSQVNCAGDLLQKLPKRCNYEMNHYLVHFINRDQPSRNEEFLRDVIDGFKPWDRDVARGVFGISSLLSVDDLQRKIEQFSKCDESYYVAKLDSPIILKASVS